MGEVAEAASVLEILDREECLRLLAGHDFGRLAMNLRAEVPIVRPVNYFFDRRTESIVFRTAYGSKFAGILLARKAVFEIDGTDHETRTGWSVIAVGLVEKITNYGELERFARAPLDPWVPGEKPYWVRVRVWTVSGRRISPRPSEAKGCTGTNSGVAQS
jgi:uncharacterized protein